MAETGGGKGKRAKPARPKAKRGAEAASPAAARRALEQSMAEIQRLLAEQDFASADEMERFLADVLAKGGGRVPVIPGHSPVERAQDVMYEAWEARGAKRVALARKALEISADCADAYVLLAGETARSPREACELYAQGVAAGERALGEGYFREMVGHFWGLLETRPYMRARTGLGQCLWELGEREAAVTHYQDMLRLNPNDNQGLRYVLLQWLLQLGRDEEAGRLLRRYKGDGMAAWLYTWALWAFRREGDSRAARRRLGEALGQNPHVPDYLLGRKRMPRRLPDVIGWGDEREAIDYAASARDTWRQTPGALEWLGGREGRADD